MTRSALKEVAGAISADWRRADVERAELARFVVGPDDVVVVVGQDGLVANVARYLDGQPVVGVNPLPDANVGVLVPHAVGAVRALLRAVVAGKAPVLERTMVEADADDGQSVVALNEVYVGQPTHQSARYRLRWRDREERQSSSGLIVGTGTGATGWCASLQRVQAPTMSLPTPTEGRLGWFVREAWPSPTTGAGLVSGVLEDDALELHVESDSLVVFGDGMEDDRLTLGWGQRLTIRRAARVLRTVA